MKSSLHVGAGIGAILVLAACSGGGTTPGAPPSLTTQGYTAEQSSTVAGGATTFVLPQNVRRACALSMNPDVASCDALQRTDTAGPNVSGYGPADLQSAYKLPSSTRGSGQTVALVDAFDDPNAEADLQVYRSYFGLPECSTANGCFKKVNQRGEQGNYPQPDTGWSAEITIDIDMVSAVCPNCNILLVEADDNYFHSLGPAVTEAVRLGANVVSNSYGAYGDYRAKDIARHYDHPGTIITVSSGDGGFGPAVPAGFPTVVSIGGTSLRRDASVPRGWIETVWPGTGSGCDTKQPKPPWQNDRGCSGGRTQNDVSADSAPSTGVAMYDTYNAPGWQVYGGTSVASPIIASVYALAGNAAKLNAAESLWASDAKLNDPRTGSNGTCRAKYLCNGRNGYDGPTGNGTPKGIEAF